MSHRTFESLDQAAQRTGVGVETLRRRIATGDLPAYRCDARILRVDPNDVDELMKPLYAGGPRRRAARAS